MNGERALQNPSTSLADRFRNPNGNPGEVFVMAHRGAFLDEGRVILPENSAPAIERARRIGCGLVEIDVRFTSDGTAIVMHDTTLDRTTAARGEVASWRHSDLREVPLVHPQTRQEFAARVPTLEEAFLALGDEMLVNVELKTGIEAIPEIANRRRRRRFRPTHGQVESGRRNPVRTRCGDRFADPASGGFHSRFDRQPGLP